jgi:hypothetical protein
MIPCKVSIDGIHVSLTVTPMVLMNIMVCKISLKAILDLVMALPLIETCLFLLFLQVNILWINKYAMKF